MIAALVIQRAEEEASELEMWEREEWMDTSKTEGGMERSIPYRHRSRSAQIST